MITSLQDFLFPYRNNSMVNNTLDTSQGPERFDLSRKWKVAQASFLTIAFLGIFVNAISILALKKSKELRNPTTSFVVNLCTTDLLFCAANLITYLKHSWNLNDYVCRWNTMAKYFFGTVSVYLIVGITINRFICVVYPQIYRTVYKPIPLGLQLALIWLYSLMLASIPFFELWGRYGYDVNVGLCTILIHNGRTPLSFFYMTAFVIPTATFTVCYPLIFRATHKSYKRAKKSNRIRTPAALNGATEQKNAPRKKSSHRIDVKELKVLKVMLVVVVAFILCYFPVGFVKIPKRDAELPTLVIIAYFTMNMSNVINPFIYIVMSAEFRKAYLELFKCKNTWYSMSTSSNTELIRA